jgi:integrase
MVKKSRRRGRGEGSVFQRKDGRWVVQVWLEDGKRKQFYAKSQKEGIEKLRKVQRELEQGTLATGPQQTVRQYLEYWLEEVHRPTLRVGTYVKYRVFVYKHLIPVLGHLRLQKLTPQHVQSLYRQKEQELSPGTIRLMHAVLRKALDTAVRWNLLARNVCDVVSPPRVGKHEMHTLTVKQAHKLLAVVREHRLEMLLTMALVTGMRRGELLALRWSSVDLGGQCVYVSRTVGYVTGHGYVEAEPKTTAGKRVVMLPSFVVDMLRQHRAQQQEAKLRVGSAWEDRDLVFVNRHGGYLNPAYLLVVFKKVLTQAGLHQMRFHDLRHSAATILLSMNVHPKIVQEILGHSDISMTLNIYSHVVPAMQSGAVGKWEEEFRPDHQDGEETV